MDSKKKDKSRLDTLDKKFIFRTQLKALSVNPKCRTVTERVFRKNNKSAALHQFAYASVLCNFSLILTYAILTKHH